jgi:radical SAM protein with 4Fe4S-binding SPASM domain
MSQICEQATGLSDAQYWKGFSSKIENQRIPISGSLALTHRCNLGCIHCYAKEKLPQQDFSNTELSTGHWKKIVAEVKEAGCLYLLLTGGEPLLREDFSEIYSFAKRNGFLVTLFTNGTLVTDETVALLRQLPPRLVEISLYGATAETHDGVTGIPGSFDRARQGIEILIGQGINVSLKSVLMTLNLDEFSAIEDLAHSYGVKFRLDAAIFPTLAGDRGPIDLRVSPEQAVDLELSDPDRIRDWHEFLDRFRSIPSGERLYVCGAGKTTFHIDPQGWLYPCLMVRAHKYSLLSGSFRTGWDGAVSRIQEETAGKDFPCSQCEQKLFCGYCPGFFDLENGRRQVQSEYLCAVGRFRYETITHKSFGE